MAKNLKIAKGQALWAKVFEPDTKFDPAGIYSVDLLIEETEAQELCEYLDSVCDQRYKEEIKAKPKLKASLSTRPAYEPDYDEDGNETGKLKFKFKLKASGQTRDGRDYTQKPAVVDAKRKPMDSDIAIGNGSTVKVAFEPVPYVMASTKQVGVSLRLKAMQVIDLVQYGGGAASVFDEEEGFEVEEAAPTTTAAFDVEDDDDGVEGDF